MNLLVAASVGLAIIIVAVSIYIIAETRRRFYADYMRRKRTGR